MKKSSLIFILALLTTVSAWAQHWFTLNGLDFQVTDEANYEVDVVGYTEEPTGALYIPEMVHDEENYYTVTGIGDEAFANCEKLTELIIPGTVTIIGEHAFHYNRQFAKIVVHATTPPLMCQDAFANTELTTPVYVPAQSLDAYKAANGWKDFNLKAIDKFTVNNLSYQVTDANARKVSVISYISEPTGKLDIPETVSYDDTDYTVTGIGDEAFANCENLTELIIPGTVTIIGEHAFHYNRQFAKIIVHATTPPIMCQDAFANTELTTPVYVPAQSLEAYRAADGWKDFNLQVYDPNKFTVGNLQYNIRDASAKTVEVINPVEEVVGKLVIPSTVSYNGTDYIVEALGYGAFYNATKVTELVLPPTIKLVDDLAFFNCPKMEKLTVLAVNPPSYSDNLFPDLEYSRAPVFVPAESLEKYKKTLWAVFNLQAISSTAINAASMPESISVNNGTLHNPQGLAVSIYDLKGRLVYSGNATAVELPAGIYVVSCNGASCKVMF